MALSQIHLCYRSVSQSVLTLTTNRKTCSWNLVLTKSLCLSPFLYSRKAVITQTKWTSKRTVPAVSSSSQYCVYAHIYKKTYTHQPLWHANHNFFYSFLNLQFLLPLSSHQLHKYGFILNYSAFQQSTWKAGKLSPKIVENNLFSALYQCLDGDINHTGLRANSPSSFTNRKNTVIVVWWSITSPY